MCHDSLALTLSSSMSTLQTQTYGANLQLPLWDCLVLNPTHSGNLWPLSNLSSKQFWNSFFPFPNSFLQKLQNIKTSSSPLLLNCIIFLELPKNGNHTCWPSTKQKQDRFEQQNWCLPYGSHNTNRPLLLHPMSHSRSHTFWGTCLICLQNYNSFFLSTKNK